MRVALIIDLVLFEWREMKKKAKSIKGSNEKDLNIYM